MKRYEKSPGKNLLNIIPVVMAAVFTVSVLWAYWGVDYNLEKREETKSPGSSLNILV